MGLKRIPVYVISKHVTPTWYRTVGWVDRLIPGLALTPLFFMAAAGRDHRITHLRSGLALPGYFPSRQAAYRGMRRIATLLDWTLPYRELLAAVDEAELRTILRDAGAQNACPDLTGSKRTTEHRALMALIDQGPPTG